MFNETDLKPNNLALKTLITSFILFFTSLCLAQSIETFSGLQYNFKTQEDRIESGFQSNSRYQGVSLGILFDPETIGKNLPAISFQVDKLESYTAIIQFEDGEELFDAGYSFAIAIYPVNKTFFENLQYRAGLEIVGLLRGASNMYFCGNTHFPKVQSEREHFYLKGAMNYLINNRISYDLDVFKKVMLRPHYNFQIGLNKNYLLGSGSTFELKQFIGLALVTKFGE